MNNKALIKCGFSKDENNSKLTEIFQDNAKFKKVHIDIYSSNPFEKAISPVLMLRHSEKNATVSNNRKSIVIKADDKYNTYIAELLLDTISENYIKENFENSFDFILKCQNIFYKITIFK